MEGLESAVLLSQSQVRAKERDVEGVQQRLLASQEQTQSVVTSLYSTNLPASEMLCVATQETRRQSGRVRETGQSQGVGVAGQTAGHRD